jgi:Zn-dependent protease
VSSKLEYFLYLMPIVLASLTLHELAHAWTAYKLGDWTAKYQGRLSLNPLVHLDPLGTAFFAISYWASGFLFGWAKPVPVDPSNLRWGPQRGMAIVAVAGPLTNFLIALAIGAYMVHGDYGLTTFEVLRLALLTNIVLGVFNLLPIPPLDGSRIVGGFMDRATWVRWSQLDQYGMVFLLLLFFVFQRQFSLLVNGATDRVTEAIFTVVGA